MELALLETTGPFGLKDITRETTDHVKAAYGLILKVYFIHAAGEKIRLWSFGLVSKELYVFYRVRSAVLPVNHVDSKEELKDITNMMWELKTSIDYSHELLQEIKKSHEKNKKLVEERLNGHEKVRKLDRLLVDNVEVKLSSRVSEADDIYVYSSPLCPDSPYSN